MWGREKKKVTIFKVLKKIIAIEQFTVNLGDPKKLPMKVPVKFGILRCIFNLTFGRA